MADMVPLLVAMAGGTASGKTTLARRFAEQFPGMLRIGHDRYYLTVSDPHNHNYDIPEALDNELLASHLDQLSRGEQALLPRYDFVRHARLPNPEPVKPATVVLVEGILVLAEPALANRFHLKVWVDAPDDLRLMRRVRRDVVERGWSVAEVLSRYETMVRPAHNRYVAPCAATADLVLDGMAPVGQEVGRLIAVVEGLLGA